MAAKGWNQRRIALELRYAIDLARREPEQIEQVRRLLDRYPHALASSHVCHNLGYHRLAWLHQEDLVKKNDQLQKQAQPGERAIRSDISRKDLRTPEDPARARRAPFSDPGSEPVMSYEERRDTPGEA